MEHNEQIFIPSLSPNTHLPYSILYASIQDHSDGQGDIDPLPVPVQKSRSRRGAVSGSVMTEEQATSYVKKVRSMWM